MCCFATLELTSRLLLICSSDSSYIKIIIVRWSLFQKCLGKWVTNVCIVFDGNVQSFETAKIILFLEAIDCFENKQTSGCYGWKRREQNSLWFFFGNSRISNNIKHDIFKVQQLKLRALGEYETQHCVIVEQSCETRWLHNVSTIHGYKASAKKYTWFQITDYSGKLIKLVMYYVIKNLANHLLHLILSRLLTVGLLWLSLLVWYVQSIHTEKCILYLYRVEP